MADSTLNRFNASGDNAARAAFTPSPPTPASGPDPGYTFWDTDDQQLYAWDVGLADWVAVDSGSGGGNITSTTAIASPPGSPATGDLDLYTDSYYLARYSGSVWSPWGPIFPMGMDNEAADFVGTNVGSSTLTDVKGALYFQSPANASADSLRLYSMADPATPYTVTAAIMLDIGVSPPGYWGGILLRESGTGKIVFLCGETSATISPFGFDVMNWTNATTFSSRSATRVRQFAPLVWLRIINTGSGGSALTYQYSYDGQNWNTLFSSALNAFFTTAPDEIGLGGYGHSGDPIGMNVLSWKVT